MKTKNGSEICLRTNLGSVFYFCCLFLHIERAAKRNRIVVKAAVKRVIMSSYNVTRHKENAANAAKRANLILFLISYISYRATHKRSNR